MNNNDSDLVALVLVSYISFSFVAQVDREGASSCGDLEWGG